MALTNVRNRWGVGSGGKEGSRGGEAPGQDRAPAQVANGGQLEVGEGVGRRDGGESRGLGASLRLDAVGHVLAAGPVSGISLPPEGEKNEPFRNGE
jgi:hypothetical protein